MGAFYLTLHNAALKRRTVEATTRRALSIFAEKGLTEAKSLKTELFDLYLFHKRSLTVENWIQTPDGDFACASGTLIYNGEIGRSALRMALEDWHPCREWPHLIIGNYCLIIFKRGELYIIQPASGLYHVYVDENNTVFSSSLLAVCRSLDKCTISPQGFFEYVLNGAVYGDKTVVSEVNLLDCGKIFVVSDRIRAIQALCPKAKDHRDSQFPEVVEAVSADLLDHFRVIHKAFDSDICAALSGGYDSRLMLALMRKVGIDPYLYVYGSNNSKDVKVAMRIAEGEGLSLEHFDRDDVLPMSPGEYRNQLRTQFYTGDGLTNTGIFDNGSPLATRIDRVSKAKLQLNGGGGEIYRNFWVLPNTSMSPSQFLKSKYDRFERSLFRPCFDKDQYFENLADKVTKLIGTSEYKLTRQQIEMLYPLFRLRYWMGMNNSHNAQFSYAHTPFAEYGLALDSSHIPLAWKNNGRFEASLIKHLDPTLAAYPSCYGHTFDTKISLKRRIRNSLKRRIPVFMRPYIRRNLHKKGELHESSLPYYLKPDFLGNLGLRGELATSEFVDIERISTPNILSRTLSVELIINGMFFE